MLASTDCNAGLIPQRNERVIDGVELSYLEWGHEGKPMVLLHGITSSARTWWRVAPALAELGYHIFAVDMPGHGESQAVDRHKIPYIAGLIANLVRSLELSDIVLIGHSWGGITALEFARGNDADLLQKLIVIDPPLAMDPERSVENLPAFLEHVSDPPEITLPHIRAEHPDWHECDMLWKAEAYYQCRQTMVRGLFLDSGNWDAVDALSQLTIPNLLLVPDPENSVITAEQLDYVKQNTNAEYGKWIYVPNTSHNMFRGAGYEPTINAIRNWLNQH